MISFIIVAHVAVIVWLLAALWEAVHERRLAIKRMEMWRAFSMGSAEEAHDARLKLAAALRAIQAAEESQRHVLASFVIVEADGRKIVLFRN